VADAFAYAMLAALFSFLAVRIVLAMLRQRRVTSETVAGALSAYLFIGLIWAAIFALLERLHQGSVKLTTEEEAFLLPSCIYYSFVTLTSLGYGDVTPNTMPTQYLSFVEAATGQLYLAVLVARLVGRHTVHSVHEEA
jgi:hypothetical protein